MVLLPLLFEPHGHFRQDGLLTPIVVDHALQVCQVNVVEPNLRPQPVLTVKDALSYYEYLQRLAALRGHPDHQFLMTLQLTPQTTPAMVQEAYSAGIRIIKYYPAGVTTNSDNGITNWRQCYAAIEMMSALCKRFPDMPMVLQMHGEDPNQQDHHRREGDFLVVLEEIATLFPDLRISFAHASTAAVVELAKRLPNVGLEITVHHLMLTWDDVVHDISHHMDGDCFCAPVVKTEEDRRVLLAAAVGEYPELQGRVYLGLDFAPHAMASKTRDGQPFTWPSPDGKLPNMGVYSLDVAVPLLVSIFLKQGGGVAMDRLRHFACWNGAQWFGVKLQNRAKLKITYRPQKVPDSYGGILRSFMAGRLLDWTVERVDI